MLLECPNCSTGFKVRSGALGEVGRTVRCSRCSFEWFAEPRDLRESAAEMQPPVAEATDTAPALPEFSEEVLSALENMAPEAAAEAALERRKQRKRPATGAPSAALQTQRPSRLMPCAALAASVLLLGAGALTYFQETLRPLGLHGVYTLLGMEKSGAIQLANLSLTKLERVARTTYMLEGKVVNISDVPQPIPAVRIRLMSKDGNVLREWKYAQPGIMKPREVLPFSANKLDAAYEKSAHHFQVDIGSGFELAIRN